MKISIQNNKMLFDIARKTNDALLLDGKYRFILSKIAQDLYDWNSVGEKISLELNSMKK